LAARAMPTSAHKANSANETSAARTAIAARIAGILLDQGLCSVGRIGLRPPLTRAPWRLWSAQPISAPR
jgi:hypothetical protein